MNIPAKKSLIFLFIFFVSLYAAYYAAVNYFLPYAPICPHRISKEELSKKLDQKISPSSFGLKFISFEVFTKDSVKLRGWLIDAKNDSVHGTIVLLHGIANCKESYLQFAGKLAEWGYNIVLFDLRAHGESGGKYCTFGYYEKYDVSAVIDKAVQINQALDPIGIYGNSLGGGIAIQAMSVDERIKCGIAESPFADLREVVHNYWNRMTAIPLNFIPDNALKNSERIANFLVDQVKPEECAIKINSPVLIIHGTLDEKIPVQNGKRIFKKIKSPDKKLYLVKGAGHDNIPLIGEQFYYNEIKNFLLIHLNKYRENYE